MTVWLVIGLTVVWFVNYATAALFAYPVAYCWGGALLRPVLTPYAHILLLLAAAYLAYALVRYGVGLTAAKAAALMVLVAGAGDLARTVLFATHATCGNFK